MTAVLQAALPLPELAFLPGMGPSGWLPVARLEAPAEPPAAAGPPDPPPRPGPEHPTLDADQPPLPEAEPAPVQLSLLPDPPPWEAAERRARPRRAPRRRGAAAPPGQLPLF